MEARIHLLPARKSPVVVAIRRKPTKIFHVVRWSTITDEIEYGSWFHGSLYPMRSDVSYDGKWMVYLALGRNGETWNGICQPPWLKTIVNEENIGTWYGGGYWENEKSLVLNGWSWGSKSGSRKATLKSLPFRVAEKISEEHAGNLGVLYSRWRRDGWLRQGRHYGTEKVVEGEKIYTVECKGDDGWYSQPTESHPMLKAVYLGYRQGYQFRFWLEGCPNVLDEKVDWVCWDATGQLIVARSGALIRYMLNDLMKGRITAKIDLEHLQPQT